MVEPVRAVQQAVPLPNLPLPYPVFVQGGSLDALGQIVHTHARAHRVVVISDATVATAYGDRIRAAFGGAPLTFLAVPPGEDEKTREQWAALTDAMLDAGAGRDTTVVAFGGGVVCDLAGFVAATFMRGVPVVQVPTTLLAMVDASVGGKTAVDTPAGKNLVGAFHQPSAVVIDPMLLRSLPTRVFRAGLAEMIKHGVVSDSGYFERMLHALPTIIEHGFAADQLPSLIGGSVRIKASVVARDEREGGIRQVLNFGHSIAHALEQVLEYRVSHGEAVAVGMVVEARIAELSSIAGPGTAGRIAAALRAATLPTCIREVLEKVGEATESGSPPPVVSPAALLEATRGDKKARAGAVRYALPCRIGEMESANDRWSVPIADPIVLAAITDSLN